MIKRKVIKYSNLPRKAPVWQTLVYFLALDRFHAPEWVWGAVGLLVLLIWIYFIVDVAKYQNEETDVFKIN
jgi:hypothetical protein